MRTSSILISGAVAAVAVAGSASASVVLQNLAFQAVDDFTVSQTTVPPGNSASVGWTPSSNVFGSTSANGGPWVRRSTQSNPGSGSGNGSGVFGGGLLTVSNPGLVFGPVSGTTYQQFIYDTAYSSVTAATPTADLSGLFFTLNVSSFSLGGGAIDTRPTGGNVQVQFYRWDGSGTDFSGLITLNVTGTGAYTFSTAGLSNMQSTVRMVLTVWDNITFNAFTVPAPGAVALLGAAGLVGSRRRRF